MPADIANVVLFLASGHAGRITGQVSRVDGESDGLTKAAIDAETSPSVEAV